jgi:hypothetical protein
MDPAMVARSRALLDGSNHGLRITLLYYTRASALKIPMTRDSFV